MYCLLMMHYMFSSRHFVFKEEDIDSAVYFIDNRLR